MDPVQLTWSDEISSIAPAAEDPLLLFLHTRVESEYPLHFHTYYELELIQSGKGIQYLNGRPYPLHGGTMYLLSPMDMHRIEAQSPLDILSVKVHQNYINAELQTLLDVAPLMCDLKDMTWSRCTNDLLRISECLRSQNAYKNKQIIPLLELIVLELLQQRSMSLVSAVPEGMPKHMRLALTYMKQHFLEPITFQDVAQAVHLSPNYFCTMCTKVFGYRFVELLSLMRVQHACTLLNNTNMNITEIAYASAFGSLSQFLRMFHRFQGMTPSEWRQNTHGLPKTSCQ